jgi:hypothetical protein
VGQVTDNPTFQAGLLSHSAHAEMKPTGPAFTMQRISPTVVISYKVFRNAMSASRSSGASFNPNS